MTSSRAFILTKQSTDIGQTRHSSFTHFLDLIDACGFDLNVGSVRPSNDQLSAYKLIFIDYEYASIAEVLSLDIFSTLYKNRIVLFSADINDDNIEIAALKLGVRGVFYKNDKLENVIKGIQQIKNGKYWFRRDTMESALRQLLGAVSLNPVPSKDKNDLSFCLTKREHMIVTLISQGAQNKEIAEQLHISINTVKTHVYSIFRKTNCKNRVQLIKWSMEMSADA